MIRCLMTHWKASNGCEALGQQKRVIERVDELKTEDVRETVSVRKLFRVVFFPLVRSSARPPLSNKNQGKVKLNVLK